jgi:ketosteroid isomerase-like protein
VESSVQSGSSIRKTIERHNANAVRWYATGDIDSLSSLFSEDAWQMPPNSAPLVGRAAIHEFWSQAIQWGKWEFLLQTQDVEVSGTIAVERGKYELKFTAGPAAPSRMASFEDRGNYLVHWRHESDGHWRIVGDAPVSELPMHPGSKQ